MSVIRIYDDNDGMLIGEKEMGNPPRKGERISFRSDKEGKFKSYTGTVVDVHYNFDSVMSGIEITIKTN